MQDERQRRLRELPKIDAVLLRPEIAAIAAPRWAVAEAVRAAVQARRDAILAGATATPLAVDEVAARADTLARPLLRRVINATGVVLHTNLGRAPLAAEALAAVVEVAAGYSNLEYALEARGRGSRHGHAVELVRALTGAEDAVVVNNGAGAVMLGLAALAAGRPVVVSRGELIEIGGSFRVPDVMRLSGARLVEVGTTNKTHLRDYETVLEADTALLLKVHRSNFRMLGFTAEVPLDVLVKLARARGVASMIDLGSGSLLSPRELEDAGLPAEPGVREVVASGVDLVAFSGDKLLGGPQAGIVAGRASAVAAAREHPLMRALRPDKLTLAALCATLAIYRDGRHARDVPALAMLTTPEAALRARADALAQQVSSLPADLRLAVVPCVSAVGGGALPDAGLPSWAVTLRGSGPSAGTRAEAVERALRGGTPPVIARVHDDAVVLDVRTLDDGDLAAVAKALESL